MDCGEEKEESRESVSIQNIESPRLRSTYELFFLCLACVSYKCYPIMILWNFQSIIKIGYVVQFIRETVVEEENWCFECKYSIWLKMAIVHTNVSPKDCPITLDKNDFAHETPLCIFYVSWPAKLVNHLRRNVCCRFSGIRERSFSGSDLTLWPVTFVFVRFGGNVKNFPISLKIPIRNQNHPSLLHSPSSIDSIANESWQI